MAADHLLLAYIILVISGDGDIFGSTWVGFLIPLFSLNSSGHYPEKFCFLSAMYLGISNYCSSQMVTCFRRSVHRARIFEVVHAAI